MKRSSSRKLKSVSWAPGSDLCQVKLFSPEDRPSKIDKNSQHHLGFEGKHFQNQSKTEVHHHSQIKWKCPPSFAVNHYWCVAAGDESDEKDVQKLREMRVLKAVYPRISAIPSRPAVSFDVEKECYDDSLTPIIPLIPVEVESPDVDVTTHTDSLTRNLQSSYSEADLLVVACVAVAAVIMKNNEPGSEVDMNLLVRIFNDPIMIGKLIEGYKTATTTFSTPSNTVSLPTSYSEPVTSSVALSSPTPADVPSETTLTATMGLLPTSETRQETPSISLLPRTPQMPAIPRVYSLSNDSPAQPATTRSVTESYAMLPYLNINSPPQREKREAPLASVSSNEMNSATTMHAVAKQVQSSAGPVASKPVKDLNYYKNLVRSHGTDNRDMQSRNNFQGLKRPRNNITPGEVKFKIQKPCIYFKSARGCRNGANCPYQHDMSVQREAGNVSMTQNVKRFKEGPESPWRM